MAAQKPSLGRIVLYYEGDMELGAALRPMQGAETVEDLMRRGRGLPGTNGHREHPAIITAVWSDTCVNLTVFFDCKSAERRSSASYLPDEVFADGLHCVNSGWRWPPRVEP